MEAIDEEAVISHITDKVRMIAVNSPNNPTGGSFLAASFVESSEAREERDLLVISDEVYEKVMHENTRHYCPTGFSGMRECKSVNGSRVSFGKHGEEYLKLSCATSYDQLEEALNRIDKAVRNVQKSVMQVMSRVI